MTWPRILRNVSEGGTKKYEMREYELEQADGASAPGFGWRFIDASFLVKVLAREFRAVWGEWRVVGIPGGVLGGRIERFGLTNAGMPGNEAGRQRENGESEETHGGEKKYPGGRKEDGE